MTDGHAHGSFLQRNPRINGTWLRVRNILWEAPWSSFDLAMSVVLLLRGTYILLYEDALLEVYPQLYLQLANTVSLFIYALVCLLAGAVSLITTLWPIRPSYGLRLFARMGVAFCFVQFTLNQMAAPVLAVGAITHLILALMAVWSVLRTRHGGR